MSLEGLTVCFLILQEEWKTQCTSHGREGPIVGAATPMLGFELCNKLLLIFMKTLNALWCKDSTTDRMVSPFLGTQSPFGVDRACKINLTRRRSPAGWFLSAARAGGTLSRQLSQPS